ncbi:MAG: metallophosphoesterase [Pseudomonadota bacterium]
MRQVLTGVQREPETDVLLLTGDLVQDETRQGYERLKIYLDDLGLPAFSIPGNHDDPDLLSAVLTDARSQVGGHTLIGEWCLVFLSSYVPGAAFGRLSADELSRLDELLKNHATKHLLIALHHHPIPMDSAWLDTVGLENSEEFWRIVDVHSNVRCILWGHVHQDLQQKRNDVLLLATPSTCAQFKPKVDQFEIDDKPPAYRRLLLEASGKVSTEVVWLED